MHLHELLNTYIMASLVHKTGAYMYIFVDLFTLYTAAVHVVVKMNAKPGWGGGGL